MQFRIGDRDPKTGLYNVIWPDGSQTLNGIKIFNSAHQSGDPVLATQRSDGMLILDSKTAIIPEVVIGNPLAPEPDGYLFGQVFNKPGEDLLLLYLQIGTLSNGASDPVFAPYQTTASVRQDENEQLLFAFILRNDRPTPKDLLVRYQIGGTAQETQDYTIAESAGSLTLPGGQYYHYIYVTPVDTPGLRLTAPVTVALTLLDGKYTKYNPYVVGTITPRTTLRTYTITTESFAVNPTPPYPAPTCPLPVPGYSLTSSSVVTTELRVRSGPYGFAYTWVLGNAPGEEEPTIMIRAVLDRLFGLLDGIHNQPNTLLMNAAEVEATYGPSYIEQYRMIRTCNYTEN